MLKKNTKYEYIYLYLHICNTTKNNNTNSLAQLSSAEKLKQ